MIVQFSFFLTIAQVLIFLIHWAIFKSLVNFGGISDPGKIAFLMSGLGIASIAFLFASTIGLLWHNRSIKTFYFASAIWMGTMYWLFFASVFLHLLNGISGALGISQWMVPIGRSLFIASLFISAYGVLHSFDTQVVSRTITLPGLPASWRGKRMVMLADLHLGHVRGLNFSKKIAALVAKQKADLICIVGDFYDGVPADFEDLAKPFGDLKSRYGTFFVTGNHEEFGDNKLFVSGIRSAGIRVLNNESVDLDGLQLLGLDYRDTIQREKQDELLKAMIKDSSKPSILMKHVPSLLRSIEEMGISLSLHGHTHLGQVYPMGWITRRIFNGFDYGLNSHGKLQVLTTSGVGTWGPPQRVGTNSEIVVITFA